MSSTVVPVSQLAGTSEVAAILGCPKQQLHKLRQRDDFPAPIAMLAATPVWDVRDIRTFRDSWKRRKRTLDTAAA